MKPRRSGTLVFHHPEIYKLFAGFNENKPYRFCHMCYKYTACGPSVGFLVEDWVWNNSLQELGTLDQLSAQGRSIGGIACSSIVEGTDVETSTYMLVGDKIATFWQCLEAVNNEAHNIWMDTHGCDTCIEHYKEEDTGWSPVWPDCPECGGYGAII